MAHPFQVGQKYRNRDGEYTVVSISDPTMVIRYADGRTVESPIQLQARIWERIQEEEELGDGEFDLDENARRSRSRDR